jgi:hypothetical protein
MSDTMLKAIRMELMLLDESGKVATKYGNLKDIPSPAPAILPTGN